MIWRLCNVAGVICYRLHGIVIAKLYDGSTGQFRPVTKRVPIGSSECNPEKCQFFNNVVNPF